jgi:hypothetical protein
MMMMALCEQLHIFLGEARGLGVLGRRIEISSTVGNFVMPAQNDQREATGLEIFHVPRYRTHTQSATHDHTPIGDKHTFHSSLKTATFSISR